MNPPQAGLEYSPLDSSELDSSSSSAAGKKWAPRQGELVRVLKMGGAPGTIVAVSQGQGSGRKVSVQVGTLTMEMRLSDVAPLAGGMGAEGAPRKGVTKRSNSSSSSGFGGSLNGSGSGVGDDSGGRRGTDLQEAGRAKERLRAGAVAVAGNGQQGGFPSSNGGRGSSAAGVAVAVQTSRNTVDVRGKLADDAADEVDRALSMAAPGSVLFVVHGVGTGRVRAAVREVLKRSSLVTRVEEQAESLGGCTLAYTKS